MFYTYADKMGTGFFGSWQMRQIAFDTLHRYLYYSEPTTDPVPTRSSSASHTAAAPSTTAQSGGSGGSPTSSGPNPAVTPAGASAGTGVSEVSVDPTTVVWRSKLKVTAVLPIATTPAFNPSRCSNERDLYQLEIQGESRSMMSGEAPPAGPLLCPAAGLSSLERSRCNAHNPAFIRDPFFLKELFDSLRDQFEELAKERVRAAAAAADVEGGGSNSSGGGSGGGAAAVGPSVPVMTGVQTITSPRGPKGEPLHRGSAYPIRLIFRCRDEREFRRLWFVLQSVLGYDKLSVRPYRGLPPYDPRNGVAFAHIPMSVWHTFASLDKAVFYTFTRGNVYALEAALPPAAAASQEASRRTSVAGTPKLKRILAGAYLCITHDSVLCMRETGNIPRWLRLAEVQEFHWDLAATDPVTHAAAPFCVFLSDPPIPDLFFEPLPPAYGADAIAAYAPLVDVRRLASVVHDSCFASLSTRRVIRMREVADASMEAYVERTVREGRRPPATQQPGVGYNSTLSCPLPKEQLAAVWQQVQAELLERGNMASRAAIPIYASNARDVELSEDQLSTVERKLDEERERRDDIVGMPLERARQLERRQSEEAAAAARGAAGGRARCSRGHRARRQHRDPAATAEASASPIANSTRSVAPPTPAQSTATLVMSPTLELLQTPQLQGRFAVAAAGAAAPATDQRAVLREDDGERDSVHSSNRSLSTMVASEYSSYIVPGSRYISHEEWHSAGYAAAQAAAAATGEGAGKTAPTSAATAADKTKPGNSGKPVASTAASGGAPASTTSSQRYPEERTVNEIVGRSMAALDGSRTDLSLMDR